MPAQIARIVNQQWPIVELSCDRWMHPRERTPSFYRAQRQVAVISRFEHCGGGVVVDRKAVDPFIPTANLSEADIGNRDYHDYGYKLTKQFFAFCDLRIGSWLISCSISSTRTH